MRLDSPNYRHKNIVYLKNSNGSSEVLQDKRLDRIIDHLEKEKGFKDITFNIENSDENL